MIKLTMVMICILIFTQGYTPTNTEETGMNKYIFTIADFVDIKPGMSYVEVMNLLDVTRDGITPVIRNFTTETFNLNNGAEMRLWFLSRNTLLSMSIFDPSGREFRLIDPTCPRCSPSTALSPSTTQCFPKSTQNEPLID